MQKGRFGIKLQEIFVALQALSIIGCFQKILPKICIDLATFWTPLQYFGLHFSFVDNTHGTPLTLRKYGSPLGNNFHWMLFIMRKI